jgi:FtsP/CotA-like multicopper oxidase with cupredoxin domain
MCARFVTALGLVAVLLVGIVLARSWSSGPSDTKSLSAPEVSGLAAARADERAGGRVRDQSHAVRPVRPGTVRPGTVRPVTVRPVTARPVLSAPARAVPAGPVPARATRSARLPQPVHPVRTKETQRSPRARAAPVRMLAAVSITLCAEAGSATMPDGAVLPIWGLGLASSGDCTSVDPVVPGPVLVVNVGEAVTITLRNGLAENVSLIFPGQSIAPDAGGAAPGQSISYTFTPSRPGTFLYEAGTNATRQVAMGLYGALIVRSSTPGQAYGPGTEYDRESVLVLSEIDPALNANPNGFNLLNYAPRYWLINGKAYPGTDAIAASPGQRLLLRYVNASPSNHTMELLGAHQQVIASDGYPASFPYYLVSQSFAAGGTGDVIVTLPPSTPAGTRLPLYNRQLRVTNGAAFPGGMLTFVDIVPPGP